MEELRLKALAKINLGLDVTGRRENGYHDLRMIMQTVHLHDKLTIRRTRADGIRMETNLSYVPADSHNLVWKAAALLFEEFQPGGGVYITLEKHIPVAAGLAGGSSDAAAAMVGLNRLLHLNLSTAELMERGVKIGADVPYCILRGTALAEGIGEKLTPLSPPPACKVLLAKLPVHVSTAAVYQHLHLETVTNHPDIDAQIDALDRQSLTGLCSAMGNVLETVTIPMFPDIALVKEQMLTDGAAGSLMSGSGPTVFGLFEDEKEAFLCAEHLRSRFEGIATFVTDFFNTGLPGGASDSRKDG